jgi:hypothetical protein
MGTATNVTNEHLVHPTLEEIQGKISDGREAFASILPTRSATPRAFASCSPGLRQPWVSS